ncbi:hypothetical protein ACXR2U_22340 [Jatrophihabitans sp. YIM 134969]
MSSTGPTRPADPDRPDASPTDDGSGPGRPDPVRDVRSDDDRDVGWGEDLDRADRGDRDRRWYEEQRPPHWE